MSADNCKVERLSGGFGRSYSYRVTGKEEDVAAWYERLCRDFHPAGYGTMETGRRRNEDGTVTADFWHSHSCD